MRADHVDFLVEEPSAEAFLLSILPRLLADVPFSVFPFQCKEELLRRLPERLQGYARWLPEGRKVVVLLDRDDDDCKALKARLEAAAETAGLTTRSRPREGQFTVVNRIAVEELEAWYFGEWAAVRAAYPRVPETIPAKAPFRDPDAIRGGTWEAFERVLKNAGYFRTGLRKVEAAREVSAQMKLDANTSRSFRALREALIDLVRD
ncbi:MAG: DUF4276 family protein [Deltaproteobacteria bacterium]|nr:DUF4276 family protein [Deltaproteobacteria bacterium]